MKTTVGSAAAERASARITSNVGGERWLQHRPPMSERDNDLRGTAATKFYIAGFSMRQIAETLAWEEESVEKIMHPLRKAERSLGLRG